jgi:signal peptidase I
MSKHRSRDSRQASSRPNDPPDSSNTGVPSSTGGKSWFSAASVRETIESVAIAFVLAFLIRTFEAEAFVIPTGSMAPTLSGRNKDLTCSECGYAFQVSASEEVAKDGTPLGPDHLIDQCICPMCSHHIAWNPRDDEYPSYSGDRILVNKFAFEFNDPKPWDVVVFKFPNGAQENYIKRLIGLPNETVRIHLGDIWKKNDLGDFELQRKPPVKLLAMLQPVFDNDLMPKLKDLGLPERWRAEPATWTTKDFSDYHLDGKEKSEAWLRYENRVPPIWPGNKPSADVCNAPPQLVSDLTAYDTSSSISERNRDILVKNQCFSYHWVGDLAVQCEAEVGGASGTLALELVKGGRRFQCRFDLATGRATFSTAGPAPKQIHAEVDTPVHGPGKHQLRFANCDRQLYLWVDEQCVATVPYGDEQDDKPDRADLQPAGIAAAGADVTVRHIRILRDIYYIAAEPSREPMYDYKSRLPLLLFEGRTTEFFSQPENWDALDPSNLREYTKTISPGEYFVMGDNSAKSDDSRDWGCVPDRLMIGKAFFVYWPHSWHRIPYLKIPCPYFPNFARMRLIH